MQITIREPGSALTHFIGMMMALAAATPLLIKAAASSTAHTVLAMRSEEHTSEIQSTS